jgi:hypothetical protein
MLLARLTLCTGGCTACIAGNESHLHFQLCRLAGASAYSLVGLACAPKGPSLCSELAVPRRLALELPPAPAPVNASQHGELGADDRPPPHLVNRSGPPLRSPMGPRAIWWWARLYLCEKRQGQHAPPPMRAKPAIAWKHHSAPSAVGRARRRALWSG